MLLLAGSSVWAADKKTGSLPLHVAVDHAQVDVVVENRGRDTKDNIIYFVDLHHTSK